METEKDPREQAANNNPKQKLSYFNSLNHIEARDLGESDQFWETTKKAADVEEKKQADANDHSAKKQENQTENTETKQNDI